MAGISVEIKQGDLKKALDQIGFFRFGLKAEVQKITDVTGLLIESTAKELVKVDTGRLRASINYDRASGSVGTNVSYAGAQEFSKNGRPYLYPAAERWRQSYLDAIKAAILKRG